MNFLTGLLIVAILFSSAGTFFVDGITGLAPEVSRDVYKRQWQTSPYP